MLFRQLARLTARTASIARENPGFPKFPNSARYVMFLPGPKFGNIFPARGQMRMRLMSPAGRAKYRYANNRSLKGFNFPKKGRFGARYLHG
jgi:hypothetical protein